MSIITRMRKQTAVLWVRGSPDTYGNFSFASPVEISCRWEDVAQEFLDAQGEKQMSRAVVYADRVLKPGDRLMRGEIDSNTPENPLDTSDAFEVRRFENTPNLRATEFLKTAYL